MTDESNADEGPIEVTATAKGYYGELLRKPGDTFMIEKLEHFSFKWMTTKSTRIRKLAGLK